MKNHVFVKKIEISVAVVLAVLWASLFWPVSASSPARAEQYAKAQTKKDGAARSKDASREQSPVQLVSQEASGSSQSPKSALQTFAVVGFPVLSERGESALGVALAESLSTHLAGCSKSLIQIERMQLNEILRAEGVDMLLEGVSGAERITPREEKRLLALTDKLASKEPQLKYSTSYVVIGSLSIVNGPLDHQRCRLDAFVRMVNVKTTAVERIGVQVQEPGTPEGYARLQMRLAQEVARRLGVSDDEIARMGGEEPESWDVYRQAGRARELLYREEYQNALDLCNKALAAGVRLNTEKELLDIRTEAYHRLMTAKKKEEQPDKFEQLLKERVQTGKIELQMEEQRMGLRKFSEAKTYRRTIAGNLQKKEDARQLLEDAIGYIDDFLGNVFQRKLWTMETGDGADDYTPVQVGDALFVVIRKTDHLLVLDGKTGETLHTVLCGEPAGDPIAAGKYLCVPTKDGLLKIYDIETWEPYWDVPAGAPIAVLNEVDGIVYGVTRDNRLRAWDIREKKSVLDAPKADDSSPPTVVVEGSPGQSAVVAYVGMSDHFLRKYNLSTGALVWETPVNGDVDSPAVGDDKLFAVGRGEAGQFLLWAFDRSTGTLLGNIPTDGQPFKPMIADGLGCAGSMEGSLYFFDMKSLQGSLIAGLPEIKSLLPTMQFENEGGELRPSSKSVMPDLRKKVRAVGIVNGILFFQSYAYLRAVDMRAGGKLLWTEECDDSYTPFIADGIVYLSDGDSFKVLDARSGKSVAGPFDWKKVTSAQMIEGAVFVRSGDHHLRVLKPKDWYVLFDLEADGELTSLHVLKQIAFAGSRQTLYAINTLPIQYGLPATGDMLHEAQVEKALCLKELGKPELALRILAREMMESRNRPERSYEALLGAAADVSHLPRTVKQTLDFAYRSRFFPGEAGSAKVSSPSPTGDHEAPKTDLGFPLLWDLAPNGDREGDIVPGPVVADGIAFTVIGKSLWAIDVATAERLWEIPAEGQLDIPRIVGDIGYVGSQNGALLAFAAAREKKIIWKCDAGAAIHTPVVMDGKAYALSEDGRIRAFDTRKGDKPIWEIRLKETSSSTASSGGIKIKGVRILQGASHRIIEGEDPIVIDDILYAAFEDQFAAVDISSGRLLWNRKFPQTIDRLLADGHFIYGVSFAKPPLVDGGRFKGSIEIFDTRTGKAGKFPVPSEESWIEGVTLSNGILYLTVRDDKNARDLYAIQMIYGERPISAKQLWAIRLAPSFVSRSPVIADGKVYAVINEQVLAALDAQTGELVWNFVDFKDVLPPAVVNGMVFTGSQYSRHRVFDADTGKLLWDFDGEHHFDVPPLDQSTVRRLAITPVVAGDRAYVGSNTGHLRAFDTSDLKSGKYAPEVTWTNDTELWSYMIWGKAGLAARKIKEGLPVDIVLSQCALSKEELEAMLEALARNNTFDGKGSLVKDPAMLRPPWVKSADEAKRGGA